MPMVLTVLEARVAPAHEAALEAGYRAAAQESFPPGLVRSTLLRAANDRMLWRIETLWESREALEAMRGTGTPRGVQIFRVAGAEPTLSVFDVVDVLSPHTVGPRVPTMRSEIIRDAIRYWEVGRLWYNLALTALASAWLGLTWPHFRPAFTLDSLGKLLILAALANVCYSVAYLVDIPMQQSTFRDVWRQRRWALWLVGTLFALVVACYWIADEIYPYVGAA